MRLPRERWAAARILSETRLGDARPTSSTRLVPPLRLVSVGSGLGAPLSDQERNLLIGAWVSTTITLTATSLGFPLAVFLAAPLQILATRLSDLYMAQTRRPLQALNVYGEGTAVSYRQGLVDVDGRPLMSRATWGSQRVQGAITSAAAGGGALRSGDPVALVVTNAIWQSSNDGLVVPARFGEQFQLRLPRGQYSLSAYALEREEGASVDPVAAIGASGVTRGALTSPLILQPRTERVTRTQLAQAAQTLTADVGSICPTCGRRTWFFQSCLYCNSPLSRGETSRPPPSLPWMCPNCKSFNWLGDTSLCKQCGRGHPAFGVGSY